MEKFTHGIMVIDTTDVNDDGDPRIIHFVGYWSEPTLETVEHLREEFLTDESHGLKELEEAGGILEYYPAPQDIIDFYWDEVLMNELNEEDEE